VSGRTCLRGPLLGLLLAAGPASAGPGPPPVLTITEASTPSFGAFLWGPSGRQFTLNPDGTITGPNAADYQFGAVPGELIIQHRGAGNQPSGQIVVENVSTSGGLIVNSIVCQFHNDPAVDCAAPGIAAQIRGRRRLLLGISVTTTQFHFGGDTASVVFDVTVNIL
jgi:hypothetical protein